MFCFLNLENKGRDDEGNIHLHYKFQVHSLNISKFMREDKLVVQLVIQNSTSVSYNHFDIKHLIDV